MTPAETRLAVQIGEGTDLQAAAESSGITKATARDRLKQIFQKTGISRQAELLRIISQLPKRSVGDTQPEPYC